MFWFDSTNISANHKNKLFSLTLLVLIIHNQSTYS